MNEKEKKILGEYDKIYIDEKELDEILGNEELKAETWKEWWKYYGHRPFPVSSIPLASMMLERKPFPWENDTDGKIFVIDTEKDGE